MQILSLAPSVWLMINFWRFCSISLIYLAANPKPAILTGHAVEKLDINA
jgi:hypothetical protein